MSRSALIAAALLIGGFCIAFHASHTGAEFRFMALLWAFIVITIVALTAYARGFCALQRNMKEHDE